VNCGAAEFGLRIKNSAALVNPQSEFRRSAILPRHLPDSSCAADERAQPSLKPYESPVQIQPPCASSRAASRLLSERRRSTQLKKLLEK